MCSRLKMGMTIVVWWFIVANIASADEKSKPQAQIEEIIATGDKRERDETEISFETERLFNIAGAGEDPLQGILALPSVTSNGDGEPVIRGSSSSDNSFYIDLVPASKLYHVYGNSIFNKYVIQSLDLHPAAFSSRFGNATGGVIDVTLRQPKNQSFTTTASLSFLQAAVLLETGITENQSIYFSTRQSMLDKIVSVKDLGSEQDGFVADETPDYSDYQLKYLWKLDDQNTVSIVAAGGGDDLGGALTEKNNEVIIDPDLQGPIEFSERFDSQGINWAWEADDAKSGFNILATKLSEKSDALFGKDQFFNAQGDKMAIRADYYQSILDRHQIKLGVISERSEYNINAKAKFVNCSDFDADCATVNAQIVDFVDDFEIGRNIAYIEDQFQLTDRQLITAGVHYSRDDYLNEGRIEPRLRWDYQLSDRWSTYISAGQYSQLPQLRELVEVIGNVNLETVKADHFVWGVNHSPSQNWSWKADLYYKKLSDLVISLNDPANPKFGQNFSNDAEGLAYGAEFQLNKSRGDSRYDGWLALSLGKAERTDLYSNETTAFDYDRPIKLDLIGNFHVNDRWRLGLRWTYQTGDRYTPIVDVIENSRDPNILEPVYGVRNSYATPDYHRLDFRATYKKTTSWGYWSVFMDIINIYGRENVNDYDYAPNNVKILDTPPPGFGANVPVQASVGRGAIPSLGIELQF